MTAADDEPFDRFSVRLDVVVRPCREEDLPALEWFGMFTPHRPLIRKVFEQHRRGEAVMLVAQVNGEASGQLWIDLEAARAQRSGVLWALRVMPCLQGRGIGARLMAVGERLLRERGFEWAELAVETDNPRARALYERLGFVCTGTAVVTDPPDLPDPVRRTQWVMAKELT